jgi:hypothetical protein
MPASKKDPTEPLRVAASEYPGVDQGTACTQSSFKAAKKAFLYVGEQGGRFKAMFKLQASLAQATELGRANPADVQVGTGGWVTSRFSAEKPMPKRLWKRWLDESYALTQGGGKATKATAKKATKAKVAKTSRSTIKKATKKTAAKASRSSAKKATRSKAANGPKVAAKRASKPAAKKASRSAAKKPTGTKQKSTRKQAPRRR